MKLLTEEEIKKLMINSYARGARDIIESIKNFIVSFEESIINDMERKILDEVQTGEKDS